MANTCAICGASINIFQSQKLADGNYLCRKTCCEKAMRNFDLVTATLPQFKMHAAQVERGTMLWEKIFVPRRKNKSMKSNFYPFYVDLDKGLMALLEIRYKFMWFGKSELACVYHIADLVGYGVVMMEQFSGALKPDIVIPFKLDKKAAKAGLMNHLSGKRLLPKVFRDQNHIDEIKRRVCPVLAVRYGRGRSGQISCNTVTALDRR